MSAKLARVGQRRGGADPGEIAQRGIGRGIGGDRVIDLDGIRRLALGGEQCGLAQLGEAGKARVGHGFELLQRLVGLAGGGEFGGGEEAVARGFAPASSANIASPDNRPRRE